MSNSRAIQSENKSERNGEHLDESAIQLKAILENSYDAIGISKNGIMLQANQAYCTVFGYSTEKEMLGMKVLDLVPLSERDRIKEYVAKRFANEPVPNFYEAIGLKKNKEEFPFEIKIASYVFNNEVYTVGFVRDITKRKLAERALAENEERFRLLAENSTDMISRHTPEGIYLYASPACEKLFGYSATEMVGRSAFDFILTEDFPAVEESRSKITSHDVATTIVYRAKRKDNKTIWIETTSHSVRAEETNVIKEIHSVSKDITDRVLASEALKQSEEKYLVIFDHAPVLISTSDFETGIFTTVNNFSLSFSGFSKDEVIGKTSAELGWITPEQRKLMIDTITTHGRIEGLEMAFKTKRGDIVYGIINGEKITIGNKNYLLITTADITARKKIELALFEARIKAEESEKRFANAIAATSDAVWELNLQTEQGFGSPRWYQMLGYENNEIKMNSESWRKLCHPDDLQSTNEKIVGSVAMSTSFAVEYRMQKKDGQWIWVLGRGKVVQYDAQGRPLLLSGTNTDITERRQLIYELEQHQNHLERLVNEKTDEIATANEELIATNDILFDKNKIIQEQNLELNEALQHLKETQTQLIQTEKLASLGVLTAGVAHEINNPLNYIMGAYEGLSVILRETQQINDPDILKLLSSLKSGVDRVSKIVKGLNQFSRNTEQLDEQCDIPAIIENCLTILKKEYKDRIEVSMQFPNDPVIISGNVGKLHQVFTNIIGNAIQAIEKTGTIRITVSKNQSDILIEIADNGCGISEENLNKILEPFFTTKDPGKGTGLGLSISYAIIKEHNGSLKFDSKVNEGTSVKINLPIKVNNN